jgi:hypothetical protein
MSGPRKRRFPKHSSRTLYLYFLIYNLGSRVPKLVREKVITQWLQGFTRHEIAENNGIGEGTVTEIVKDYVENHSDVDKQREFVVALMREGTDLDHFASSVRLNRFAEKLDVDQENFERFLANLEVYCFKKNMEINDFIKSVDDICSMSNRMQVPVKDLPHKLQQMLNEANLLAEEVKRKDKSWPAMDACLRRLRRRQQYAQLGFY